MRILSAGTVLLLIALLASCSDLVVEPTTLSADSPEVSEFASKNNSKARVKTFVAPMSGDQEVADPPVVTRARGNATFQLNREGTELSYKLIVANIENVRMAHIHLAPVGVNGPVVVWLYPSAPPAQLIPGRSQGIIAQGTITADDLVGPLTGMHLSDLINAMEAGNTYVNVHTDQYPAGEVRGQIR